MPSLRDEITNTIKRLAASRKPPSAAAPDLDETTLATDPRIGHHFGNYRILKRLGAGGMGHVYLAIDTRLGRHAALKFLSPKLKANPEMLARLQQEARTASSLNHPNILTIYDIDEAGGEPFIASEFVEGVTLRQLLERSTLDPSQSLDIVTQIASALKPAHEAGIIHRDLKPGNVMLRPDGLVKVIDFGLAKFTSQGHVAPRYEPLSDPESIAGTVQYMSPEQARGDEVDHRTDLWSLGVILYEMLARRKPFDGETESHVIVAILDHHPAGLKGGSRVASGLARIADKALAKHPDKRYPNAGEMLSALKALEVSSQSGTSRIVAAALAKRHHRRSRWLAAASLLCILAVALTLWWWPFHGREVVLGPDWFSLSNYQIVTHRGDLNLVTLSPNGKRLAYTTTNNGRDQLHLLILDLGRESAWPPYVGTTVGITFSPDGSKIYLTVHDKRDYGELYAIEDDAKEPVVMLEDVDGPITFSPDGSEFAFRRRFEEQGSNREAIFLANTRDTGEQRPLVMKYNKGVGSRVAWSADGTLAVLLPKQSSLSGEIPPSVLVFSRDGVELSRNALTGLRYISGPAWINHGSLLIFTGLRRNGDDMAAVPFELSAKRGELRFFPSPELMPNSMTASRDYNQIAALTSSRKSDLWVGEAGNLDSPELWLSGDSFDSLAWSSNDSVVYPSPHGGNVALWETSRGGVSRMLSQGADCTSLQPALVPRSTNLLFVSNCDASPDGLNLWSLNVANGERVKLTNHSTSDQRPTVAPDGDTVLYNSWSNNFPALVKMSLRTRLKSAFTNLNARNAAISPDGQHVACEIRETLDGPWRIGILSMKTGIIEKDNLPVPLKPNSAVHWSPDGNALNYVDAQDSANIWAFPLDGSRVRALTHRKGNPISDFAWNQQGTRLAWISSDVRHDAIIFRKEGTQ